MKPELTRAINILEMIQQEIPRTMGDFNINLLLDDIREALRNLKALEE